MKNKLSISTLRHLISNAGSKEVAKIWVNDKDIMLIYCQDLKSDIRLLNDHKEPLCLSYMESIKEIELLYFNISECVKYHFEDDYNNAIDRFCNLYNVSSKNIDVCCIENARDINLSVSSEYITDMYYVNLYNKLANGL